MSLHNGQKGSAEIWPELRKLPWCRKNWINIHNDYGKGKTRETEDAAHKAARKKNATAAGMIWPSETFDVAMNCNGCHGLGNVPNGGDIAKMLDSGHPLNAGFELVKYSQGSVRHRFYPPKVTGESEDD